MTPLEIYRKRYGNVPRPKGTPPPNNNRYVRTPYGLSDEDHKTIDDIYDNAKDQGLHVDHVVAVAGILPNGTRVQGMHVPWNLAPISPKENVAKSNRVSYEDWIVYVNSCVGRLGHKM